MESTRGEYDSDPVGWYRVPPVQSEMCESESSRVQGELKMSHEEDSSASNTLYAPFTKALATPGLSDKINKTNCRGI